MSCRQADEGVLKPKLARAQGRSMAWKAKSASWSQPSFSTTTKLSGLATFCGGANALQAAAPMPQVDSPAPRWGPPLQLRPASSSLDTSSLARTAALI